MEMTYTKLLEEVKKLEIEEIRADSSEMLEFAIGTDYLNQLNGVLEGYFGPPLKPPNKRPSPQAATYASPYGGIRRGQTLYCKEGDTVLNIALLWPWGDGTCVTVKIMQDQKSKFEVSSESLSQRVIHTLFGQKEKKRDST